MTINSSSSSDSSTVVTMVETSTIDGRTTGTMVAIVEIVETAVGVVAIGEIIMMVVTAAVTMTEAEEDASEIGATIRGINGRTTLVVEIRMISSHSRINRNNRIVLINHKCSEVAEAVVEQD